MKRVCARCGIVSLALILLVPWVATAQRTWHPNTSFELGAKAGVIISGFAGNGVDVLEDKLRREFTVLTDDPLVWVIGGLSFTLSFSQYFAVQPELLYHRSGKEYEGLINDEKKEFEFEIDYLTVPVLVKLSLPSNHLFRPNVYVGPHISFKLNGDLDGLETLPATADLGVISELGGDSDIDDELNLVDFGITAGVGFDIKVGPGYVTLEARYMRGFVDIFDDDEVTENAEDIVNQSISFMGGYTYAF